MPLNAPNSPVFPLSPIIPLSLVRAEEIRTTIGEGLRAVYGSTIDEENDSLRSDLFYDSSGEETIAPQSFWTIKPEGTDDGEEEESRTHQPQNRTTQDEAQTRPRQDDGL